jgi:TM2 domain-containing membrane protein YozV
MNCQNHPDIPATAYCRTCGKAVCDRCRRDAYGTVFCSEHAPAAAPPPQPEPEPSTAPSSGYSAFRGGASQSAGYAAASYAPQSAPHSDVSPGLALALGFIPGVGAIYNGQYAKGLVHAIVFGIIISILNASLPDGVQVIFAFILTAWIFYMAFEAYHTARKRRAGLPVDEYSGLVNLQGARSGAPVAGVALVVLGVILLLNTLHLLDLEYLARYWPVLLIAAGAYLLYSRFTGDASGGGPGR